MSKQRPAGQESPAEDLRPFTLDSGAEPLGCHLFFDVAKNIGGTRCLPSTAR